MKEQGIAICWGTFAVDSGRRDRDGDIIPKLQRIHLPTGGVAAIEKELIVKATECLPPNVRFQIRRAMPTNNGQGHSMAWYRTEDMDAAPTWGARYDHPGKASDEGFYCLVGEFTTP